MERVLQQNEKLKIQNQSLQQEIRMLKSKYQEGFDLLCKVMKEVGFTTEELKERIKGKDE